ncbi:four-carbon acid sugar kinase family protein [Nonomuraea sp. NPDC052634]|uniref:four-carbon acid sugar kinase family protein n=1 Tax=Nonomuraea sp. NPDC052634 TaxID=3155813 RepID=UPI003421DB73
MIRAQADAVLVLADDLTGAAETAAVLMPAAGAALIALSGPPFTSAPPVLVGDLGTRYHPDAKALVRAALADADGRTVLIKIDSLLRGNVAATVAAASLDAPVVMVPALPSAGRTVVDGVPYVQGVPLRETRTWHIEPRPAPRTVAEALDGHPFTHIPLATVRAGHPTLTEALARAFGAAGRVAICDAETDADLDAVVAAAFAADPRTRLVGAGGLATALARARDGGSDGEGHPPPPEGPPPGAPLLVIVGTAHPGVSDQVELLIRYGVQQVALDSAEPPDITAPRLRRALDTGPTVLTTSGPLPDALEEIVQDALGDRPANLVMTGGGTARRVLDALGVRELTPVGQVHHGAVHCHTPQGHAVITRPGGFGGRDSLLRMTAHLAPHHFERHT